MVGSPHKYTKLHRIEHFLKWWILWYFLNEENENAKDRTTKNRTRSQASCSLYFSFHFPILRHHCEYQGVFTLVTLCWSGHGGDVRVPVCQGSVQRPLTPWPDPHPHMSIEWGFQEPHLRIGMWITLYGETLAPGSYHTGLGVLYRRVWESGVDEKDLVNTYLPKRQGAWFSRALMPLPEWFMADSLHAFRFGSHPHSHHSLKN